MATEPTLGVLIMDAVWGWGFDRALGDLGPGRASEDRLRSLCARADAAERLAVGLVELFECNTDDGDLMREVREEYNNALAAWWAIEREVQP